MNGWGVERGMKVRDVQGETLGRVRSCGERTFVVVKGFPFPKRFEARYEDVTGVREGVVWMDETGGQLEAEAYATPLARERRAPTARTPEAPPASGRR